MWKGDIDLQTESVTGGGREMVEGWLEGRSIQPKVQNTGPSGAKIRADGNISRPCGTATKPRVVSCSPFSTTSASFPLFAGPATSTSRVF